MRPPVTLYDEDASQQAWQRARAHGHIDPDLLVLLDRAEACGLAWCPCLSGHLDAYVPALAGPGDDGFVCAADVSPERLAMLARVVAAAEHAS